MAYLETINLLSQLLIFETAISRIMAVFFITLFASSIGSFLNVCIYRIPLKKSIVKPGSYCPSCKTPIKPYHNIPILSFLLLKGKCAYCGKKISPRYCLVEFIVALLAVLFFMKNNYTLDLNYLKFFIFMTFSIMIFFIDLDHKLILDIHSYPLIVLGLLFALMGTIPVWHSIIGAASGFIIFYAIALIYYYTKKIDGLGGGDIKFITAVGAFTGIAGTIFVIFFSSFIAIIVSFSLKRNKQEIAFGPYLVIATLLYFFFGDFIIHWYLGLFINP